MVENPLVNLTLTDVYEKSRRIEHDMAVEQAKIIHERLDSDLKYAIKNGIKVDCMSLSDQCSSDIIYGENVKHLRKNGFRVWKISLKLKDSDHTNSKHYISWAIDDHKTFEEKIYKNVIVAYKNIVKSDFEELVGDK